MSLYTEYRNQLHQVLRRLCRFLRLGDGKLLVKCGWTHKIRLLQYVPCMQMEVCIVIIYWQVFVAHWQTACMHTPISLPVPSPSLPSENKTCSCAQQQVSWSIRKVRDLEVDSALKHASAQCFVSGPFLSSSCIRKRTCFFGLLVRSNCDVGLKVGVDDDFCKHVT